MTNKIVVSRIELELTEGTPEKVEVPSWDEAEKTFSRWTFKNSDCGGYLKSRFCVTFSDGTKVNGRHDLDIDVYSTSMPLKDKVRQALQVEATSQKMSSLMAERAKNAMRVLKHCSL